MVSRWVCHSLDVCAALAASASLTAVACVASASLVEAEWVASASHGSCVDGLHITECHCIVGLYPIDGFGSFGFILAMGNLRLRYQPLPMGIYQGPEGE